MTLTKPDKIASIEPNYDVERRVTSRRIIDRVAGWMGGKRYACQRVLTIQ